MKSISKILPLAAVISISAFGADESSQPTYEELVVTSSRIEQPLREVATAMSVITREELDLKGYTSVADALRTEGSVGVSNSGGTGKQTALRIRGEEGYRTLVLIDGVDLSDPSGVQVGPLLENIDSTMDISRIEILRGAQGFSYGADAGGVVNIITRSNSGGLNVSLNVEAGTDSTENIGGFFSTGNDRVDFSAAISRNATEGFNSRKTDVSGERDGAENTTAHIKAGVNMTEFLRATLVYRDIELEADYDDCGFGGFVNDCVGINQQKNVKLNVELGDNHTLSYAETNVKRDTFAAGFLSFATDADTTEFEYLGTVDITDQHSIVGGLDYEQQEADTNYGSYGKNDQKALFAEYLYSSEERLFVTVGFRYDDHSDYGKHTSYRLSAAYIQPLSNSELKYRATYGTGYRAPSLFEVSTNAGPFGNGVILQEENSRGFDLGVDWLRGDGFSLGLTYFDQEVDNQIEYDFTSFAYIQNNGRSTSKGIELSADVALSETLVLDMNYTKNTAKDFNGNDRVRRPNHLANIALTYNATDKVRINTSLRLSKGAVDFSGPLDDYEVLDMNAIYQFSPQVEIFARAQNLLNDDYEEIADFNVQGRAAFTGVRVNF